MKRTNKALAIVLSLSMLASITPQIVFASNNVPDRYEEVNGTQAIVEDAELHVYTTKNGGTVALTDSNGVETTFTQGIGYREYTATPADGWIWKGWTYEQLFQGKDLGNRTDMGWGKRYSFTNDGSDWHDPYNGTGNSISVNRLLTCGEAVGNKITYNIYANFNPTINATADTGGTITDNGVTEVNYGDSKQYNITADAGQDIASVSVDGQNISDAVGKDNFSYTFENVREPHTINVTFTNELYTVTYTDGVEGQEIFKDEVYSNLKIGDATPEFKGSLERKDYVFTGWKPEVTDTVAGTAVYTATWADDKNNNGTPDDKEEKFTVTYTDGVENEEIFKDQSYADLLSGTKTPKFNGEPKRTGYVFTGWTPEVTETVTQTVTYSAQWAVDENGNGEPDNDEKYTVSYQFINGADNKELPQEVNTMLPKTTSYVYGVKVVPVALESHRVETTDGVWLFEGWTPEEIEKLTEDTKFVGTWKYYPYQAIKANDLTVYEGGLGSNASTDTGNALPEPAWNKQMSGHTVIVNGKEWNVEEQGLPFTWKYLDEKEQEVTASARVGTYSLTVYPKEELDGNDVIIDDKVALKLPENGLEVSTVKVRDITDNGNADSLSTETFKNVYNYDSPQASAISLFSMFASDFGGSALEGTFDTTTGTHTDKCNTSEPHAHVKEGTTFLKNGIADMPVGENAKIGLLWDNLLENVLGSEQRMEKLHEKSLQAVDKGTFNTDGTIHKEFKYIDLVDMTDGNVWVGTAKNDVTVYYPYPEGVTKDNAIAVTYYDGLTRDYTVDMESADLDNEISKSNAHTVNNLRKTETGILFDVPSKQFGPIEVMWQKSYTPTYEFISGTESKELPQEVKDLLTGIEAKSYVEGASISAPELTTKEVKVADGVWTFQSWDAENKVSGDGVKFTGTWTFAKNAGIINHIPVISADDKTFKVGDTFSDEIALKGVTAYDDEDKDITSSVTVHEQNVNTSVAGDYTFTYNVTDSQGATAYKTVNVYVYPKTEAINHIPAIHAVDKTLTVGDTFDPKKDVTASDQEDGDITSSIEVVENTVDTAKAGTYTITYKVTDSKGASCTKTIYVTVNPKMENLNEVPAISAEDKVLIVGDSFDVMAGVTASDKEDGDITKDIEVIKNEVKTDTAGVYEVIYKVTDKDGASATKTIYVTVNPKMESLNEVPVINAEDKTLAVGDSFDPMKDVTASDKENGDLTAKIEVINNTVDTTKAGTYTVTYKVTDKDGASVTKTIAVTVKDKEQEEQPTTPTKPDKGDNGSKGDKGNNSSTDTKKDTSKTGQSVKTGDTSNVLLWSVIAMISLAGVVTVSLIKRRKSHSK